MLDPDPASATRSQRWVERLPIAGDRPWTALAATLAGVGLAWFVRVEVDPFLPPGFPYVTFFPVIVVASFLFGVRLGAVSAVLCGLIAWYEFIPPAGFGVTGATAIALGFYLFVVATDLALIHWMQRANRRVAAEREANRALAETRALLFHELQHRVSNNLQVAAALLSLQKRGLTDPAAKAVLDETARRLDLIGRISRQLYEPSGAAQPLLAFLEEVGGSVVSASGRDDVRLTLSGDQAVRLAPDVAMPVALIAAEAVANALEHGFADGRAGTVAVEVARRPDGIAVTVADDGHGLPAGFDAAASTSLGLKIARMMAQAQGGHFTLTGGDGTDGTLAVLTLPLPAYGSGA